ncbi:MAG: hypothetical protein G01um101425_1002 [Candidatus Peregrinibacteria bacterium Gr01-1014_25]|nr:MAG: hypothetical protein G01um101425_1002 [Candidatus Peregrinibacteria bacterium Gr01-1014_25]
MLPALRSSGSSLRFLALAAVLWMAALVVFLTAFKVMDLDVWWHIKAGQLMRSTGGLPHTDPFAYTRAGQPYLASHGWLAELVLSIVYDLAGPTGLILLRTLIALAIAGVLAVIASPLWFGAGAAALAVNAIRPGLMDRPQLFTFLLFAVSVFLALRYIDADALAADCSRRHRTRICAGFVGLQVLWVNLHGAACILGLIVFGALACQRLTDHLRGKSDRREIVQLVGVGVLLMVALLAAPSTYHNVTYVWNLLTDRTAQFIREWEPRTWGPYLRDLGPLWIAAVGVVAWTRRAPVFSALLLLAVGLLSRQAFRHEMPFVIAATSVFLWQLRHQPRWAAVMQWLERRPLRAWVAALCLLLAVSVFIWRSYWSFTQRDQLQGYGAFAPAAGAADFLDRERIDGRMFNAYDVGGYLLFRGRPVFVDGRNVDYGFAFMERLVRAAQEPGVWNAIESDYGIDYAVLSYDAFADADPLPYVGILEQRPDWALVYLDDWTAVYLKNMPEHRPTIDRLRYDVLTPAGVQRGTALQIDAKRLPALERELTRAAQELGSIKAKLLLARLYLASGFLADAQRLVDAAAAAQPGSYRPIELQAAIHVHAQRWREAAEAYERVIDLAGPIAEEINYAVLADVFERAGLTRRAAQFRAKAGD